MPLKSRAFHSPLMDADLPSGRSQARPSVPTDHRMLFRNVRFPTEVTSVERDLIAGTDEFLAIPNREINKAIQDSRLKPLLLQILGEEGGPQKGLHLPDDRLVVVSPFIHPKQIAADEAPAPMFSPNAKHVYLDRDQWLNAVRHGAFKRQFVEAARVAQFNAGYNNQFPTRPASGVHDQYFKTGTRVR